MKKLIIARNQNAFTLVELLIVLFMLALVMTSIYSLYVVHQRSAYVQDDVADVQQNLHVAMDTLAKDLQLAGFMMSLERPDTSTIESMVANVNNQNNNNAQSIRAALDLSGNYAGLLPLTDDAFSTQPQRIHADRLDLNFGSNLSSCATVTLGPQNEGRSFPALGGVFPVSSPRDLDPFSVGPPATLVRIIRPSRHNQVTNLSAQIPDPNGPGTCFRVNALSPATNPPTVTLTVDNVTCPTSITPTADIFFKNGDQICPQTDQVYPYRVTYCLGPDNNGQCPGPAAGSGITCNQGGNDQTLCLMRIDNFQTPSQSAQVLATRISGLQFSYLLDDGTEVPNNVTPIGGAFSRLNQVRAVRVTVTGQTARARALEGAAQEKTRSLTSIIKLRDRFTWL